MVTMYTILINENNELISTLPKERIVQRSKLVDTLHFITNPTYKGADMSTYIARLEYRLPVSNELHSEILELSDELYKGMLEYKVPLDTTLTKEAGDIELKVIFSKLETNDKGEIKQRVRRCGTGILTITPLGVWGDFVPDELLSPIDQRILKTEAQMRKLEEIAKLLDETKADNLTYVENKLQLTANGNKIGQAVTITSSGDSGENGYDVVEF